MKKSLLFALAATALTVPAYADDHKGMSKAEHDKMHKAHQERLAKILTDPSRAEDCKRDKYRHPAETFDFFRLHPDHVIGEYAPGGEWVSRILGRYIDDKGKYVRLCLSAPRPISATPQKKASRPGLQNSLLMLPLFPVGQQPTSAPFRLSEIPDGAKGTFDRIIVMRMLHNMQRWNIADAEIKAMRDLLKDDGLARHRTAPRQGRRAL